MRVISRKQHGVIDYSTAGFLFALSRGLPAGEGVRRLLARSAVGVLGMSVLTRYELGIVKVLPMKAHVALDLVTNSVFAAAPFLFRDESAAVKATLGGLSAFGASVVLMTDTER